MTRLKIARRTALAMLVLTACGDDEPNREQPPMDDAGPPQSEDAAPPLLDGGETPQPDTGAPRQLDAGAVRGPDAATVQQTDGGALPPRGAPPRRPDAETPRVPDAGQAQQPGSAAERAPIEVGTLVISLRGTGASGGTYMLRDATFELRSSRATHSLETHHAPSSTEIRADLPADGYEVSLQDGWRLERVDPTTGAGQRVDAVLTSEAPLRFEVVPNAVGSVSLVFRAAGESVVMGSVAQSPILSSQRYCRSDSDCDAGLTCCLGGSLGTCLALPTGGTCPLPDLTLDEELARESLAVLTKYFAPESCALIEGCVDAAGDRRLLVFTTATPNVGDADMILGDPADGHGFMYSACHDHHHYDGYANYQLRDQAGNLIREGHKQAFCLRDSSQIDPNAGESRYHCGFQGISVGYSDVYGSDLDCQWIDITGVSAGDYVLVMTINADRLLPEARYDNNAIAIPVTIAEDGPVP